MASKVLITGVTGHVGSTVLVKALQDGYSVRAAVRSLRSQEQILNAPSFKGTNLGKNVTFVEVPDILAAGAYNEAVKDVDYIIHLASPIPLPSLATTNLNQTVVVPAVRGTLNILEAALTNPKIKRVVVTSSVVGNIDISNPDAVAGPDTRESISEYTDLFSAYRASKHAALLASDVFMAENQPHFDLINVMPGYVIGPKELADKAEDVITGSNVYAFATVLKDVQPHNFAASSVHLDDVALVHVKALQLEGKKNRSFGVTKGFDPNEVFAILEKHFAKAVEDGIFKRPTGRQEFHDVKWDASATEATFGFKFKDIQQQVVSVAQQYLDLRSAS